MVDNRRADGMVDDIVDRIYVYATVPSMFCNNMEDNLQGIQIKDKGLLNFSQLQYGINKSLNEGINEICVCQ